MAIPLVAGAVAGIGGLISGISGIIAAGGPLMAFFLWIGKKLVLKFSVTTVQIGLTTAFFVSKVLLLVSILNVIRLIYNKLKLTFDSIPTTIASDNISSLSYNLLQSLGVIDALIDAFAVFVSVFVPILLIYLTKIATNALKQIKEDFRDISMMMMV